MVTPALLRLETEEQVVLEAPGLSAPTEATILVQDFPQKRQVLHQVRRQLNATHGMMTTATIKVCHLPACHLPAGHDPSLLNPGEGSTLYETAENLRGAGGAWGRVATKGTTKGLSPWGPWGWLPQGPRGRSPQGARGCVPVPWVPPGVPWVPPGVPCPPGACQAAAVGGGEAVRGGDGARGPGDRGEGAAGVPAERPHLPADRQTHLHPRLHRSVPGRWVPSGGL